MIEIVTCAAERKQGGNHKVRSYKNIETELEKYNTYSRGHKENRLDQSFIESCEKDEYVHSALLDITIWYRISLSTLK